MCEMDESSWEIEMMNREAEEGKAYERGKFEERERILEDLHRAWEQKEFVLSYENIVTIIKDEPHPPKEQP